MFVYAVRRGRDQLLLAESAPGAVCERARVPRATDWEPRFSSSGLPRASVAAVDAGGGAPRHLNGPLPTHGRTTKICKQTTRLKSPHVVVQTFRIFLLLEIV